MRISHPDRCQASHSPFTCEQVKKLIVPVQPHVYEHARSLTMSYLFLPTYHTPWAMCVILSSLKSCRRCCVQPCSNLRLVYDTQNLGWKGCRKQRSRAGQVQRRAFFWPEGSLMRVTPDSGLCATTIA